MSTGGRKGVVLDGTAYRLGSGLDVSYEVISGCAWLVAGGDIDVMTVTSEVVLELIILVRAEHARRRAFRQVILRITLDSKGRLALLLAGQSGGGYAGTTPSVRTRLWTIAVRTSLTLRCDATQRDRTECCPATRGTLHKLATTPMASQLCLTNRFSPRYAVPGTGGQTASGTREDQTGTARHSRGFPSSSSPSNDKAHLSL